MHVPYKCGKIRTNRFAVHHIYQYLLRQSNYLPIANVAVCCAKLSFLGVKVNKKVLNLQGQE